MTIALYPIKGKLKSDSGEVIIDILQISHSGMLVDSLNNPLTVNREFTAQFEFPLAENNGSAEVTVVVFRTYAELNDKPASNTKKMRHMNELVYKKPDRTFNELLIKFLATVSNRRKV